MIDNPAVTTGVLTFILKNIKHSDVCEWAEARMKTCKKVAKSKLVLAKAKIKVVKEGKALVRSLA
jgi:hypothetical protein